MIATPLRLILAAGLCCASTNVMAQALRWQVSESSGAVTIRHGAAERQAARGAVLEPGDTVSTGATGRAVLVHERDFVTLAPHSRAAVPVADQASGFTKLLQDLGNAVYKIEKRGVPHFGVTTPYLAAVVKGTTFSVTVDASGTSLQVVEGAVEVATPDGGARDLIRPGSIATIAAGDTFRLKVHGDEDRVVDSPARQHVEAVSPPNALSATASTASPMTATSEPTTTAARDESAPPSSETVVIAAITSKPVDFSQLSGGLVTGTVGVAAVTASVTQTAKTAAVPSVPSTTVIASSATVPVAPAPVTAAATQIMPAVTSAPSTPTLAATNAPIAPPADFVPTAVVTPAATTPAASLSTAAATPVATPPAAPSPPATTPDITPPVTTPPVTTPIVTVPPATTPPAATPPVTIPAVTVPAVTTPVVTTPMVTTPVVTAPAVTAPIVTTPAVTVPVASPDDLADDLTGSSKGNNGKHLGQIKNGGKP